MRLNKSLERIAINLNGLRSSNPASNRSGLKVGRTGCTKKWPPIGGHFALAGLRAAKA